MTRSLRIEYPGAIYHIISRGNKKAKIFKEEKDYYSFLKKLKEIKDIYDWEVYAYCLMPNHYHILIKTLNANLSVGMCKLNGDYAQKVNNKYHQVGHVFQGRYKSILVEEEKYLGELFRYIILNPVRAKLTKIPGDWKWSSHNEMIDINKGKYINKEKALAVFDANNQKSKEVYLDFLFAKYNETDIRKKIKSKVILGTDDFIEKIKKKFISRKVMGIAKKDKILGRLKLSKLIDSQSNQEQRNKQIVKAYKEYGYSQVEISRYLNMHFASISRIIKDQR